MWLSRAENAGAVAFAVFIIVGLIELLVIRTSVRFPMTLDNAYFLPVSYYYSNAGEIHNPWLSPIPSVFVNWHGFMQPVLVSALAFGASWPAIFLGLNILASSVLLLVAAGLYRGRLNWILSAAVLLVVLGLLLDVRARPELLAAALTVLLVAVLYRYRADLLSSYVAAGASGVILAILFCGHPAIFLISSIFVVLVTTSAAALAEKPSRILRFGTIAAIAALLTLVVCFAFVYRHSPMEYLEGILAHSRKTALRVDTGGFAKMFVLNRHVPLLLLGLAILPLCLIEGLRLLAAQPGVRIVWLSGAIISSLALLVVVYQLSVRIPATYYNFSGCLPAVLLGGCLLLRHGRVGPRGPARFTVGAFYFLVGGLAMGSMVGQAVWLMQNQQEFRTAASNRSLLDGVMQDQLKKGRKVCSELAGITAATSFKTAQHVRFINARSPWVRKPPASQCDDYIAVASEAADQRPPTIAGYHLVLNRYAGPVLPISVRPLDLRFAVYSRN
jgi:hypothetical protein